MGTSRNGPILAIILVSYFMIVLDISIVITGLPKIETELNFSPADLPWVQTAYTLAFGGLLLLGARAGDILGRRATFLLGVAIFTAASVAVGLAESSLWLIGARFVQGIGSAILAPSTLALIQTNFAPGRERTRAVAWYGAVAGIGASVGLVLGGVLADALSWRVGFFINLPIGLAIVWASRHYLGETERQVGTFDIAGAVLSTLGVAALVYSFVHSADYGWSDPQTVISLVIGVVLIGLLVINEGRARQPIMPLRLFASRERVAAYVGRILFLGAMIGFFFFMTQFLQQVLGFTPLEAGVAFLPMTIANFIVALAVPRLTARFGNGRLLAVGLATTLIGMAWLSRVSLGTDYFAGVALPMVLIGAGQGAAFSPLTASGIADVAAQDAGAASGVVNVAHQLGSSLGLAVLVSVFAAAGGEANLARGASTALAAGAVALGFALAVVLALIVLPSLARRTAVASS